MPEQPKPSVLRAAAALFQLCYPSALARNKPVGLGAYRATPGTCGAVRRADRLLAAQLHQRGVPLDAVQNAMTLAVARRLARPSDAPPLGIIRSLAYFSPVIEEVLHLPVSPEYFRYLRYLRYRIAKFTPAQ